MRQPQRYRDLAAGIEVTQGVARKVRASVCYVAPDLRAFLIDIDTATKYLDVAHYSDGAADVPGYTCVRLCKTDQTLRADGRYKRPTEIRIALPQVKGYWLTEASGTRYGCLVFAFCVRS